MDTPPTPAEAAVPSGPFRIDWPAIGPPFEARADETLLAAALRAGRAPTVSCRNGSCRTCIARLVSGRITYRIEWPGLSAEEKRDGDLLPCVAHACSDLMIGRAAGALG